MAIFKRGRIYWADFYFRKRRYQFSTLQTDKREAGEIEAAAKSRLLKGEMGIRERQPAPILKDFIKAEFTPWVEATFSQKPKTKIWYRGGCARLCEFEMLANSRMDEIDGGQISAYVRKRQTAKLNVTSVNRELQILRRVLHVAQEWGRVERIPKVRMLPGEPRRERVLTRHEELAYLAACPPVLSEVATVLMDSALRPEELYRLEWHNVSFEGGRHGCLRVLRGKTHSAARIVPMSARVRGILERRWEAASKPQGGWVFPSATRSGHIEPSTLRLQHLNVFETLRKQAVKAQQEPIKPFCLYTLRHTALTRWAEAGMSPFLLAQIAGHSSVKISQRYVHPSEESKSRYLRLSIKPAPYLGLFRLTRTPTPKPKPSCFWSRAKKRSAKSW
jgi:integrase